MEKLSRSQRRNVRGIAEVSASRRSKAAIRSLVNRLTSETRFI
jgi:hypothetical protein